MSDITLPMANPNLTRTDKNQRSKRHEERRAKDGCFQYDSRPFSSLFESTDPVTFQTVYPFQKPGIDGLFVFDEDSRTWRNISKEKVKQIIESHVGETIIGSTQTGKPIYLTSARASRFSTEILRLAPFYKKVSQVLGGYYNFNSSSHICSSNRMAFNNAILTVGRDNKILSREIESTDYLFCKLPFDYPEIQEATPEFDKLLSRLFRQRQDSINCILTWGGFTLLCQNGRRQAPMLLITSQNNSEDKQTLLKIFAMLSGSENCHDGDFKNLVKRNELKKLNGKTLMINYELNSKLDTRHFFHLKALAFDEAGPEPQFAGGIIAGVTGKFPVLAMKKQMDRRLLVVKTSEQICNKDYDSENLAIDIFNKEGPAIVKKMITALEFQLLISSCWCNDLWEEKLLRENGF